MFNFLYRLTNKYPNDSELGAKIREFVNNQKWCCKDINNLDIYTDHSDNSYLRCLKCGKLLTNE